VCRKDIVTNKSVSVKVERPHSIIDLIKQKKLKPFSHIMQNGRSETGEDSRLMLGWLKEIGLVKDPRRWCDDISD